MPSKSKKPKTSSRRMQPRLYKTAIHEAGHAVAAYWYGIPIELVTIRPTKTEQGKMVLGDTSELANQVAQGSKQAAGKIIVWCLAGFYAECRLNDGTSSLGGAGGDIDTASKAIGHLYPVKDARRTRFISTQHNAVKRLMDREDVWSAVLAVADQLMKSKQLNGSAVTRIIKSQISLSA